MRVVIGLDEVGLGPLAGPIVVGGVVLPVVGRSVQSDKSPIYGLRDSKKLRENSRRELDETIREQALFWIMAQSSAKQVDRFGVDKCRMACLKWCARFCLARYPEGNVIVDGNRPIPGIPPHTCLVKADDKIPAVQAASIIAKVRRDGIMVKVGEKYPRYGFRDHKGYGTPQHMQALKRFGPCPQHRRSYKPVEEAARNVRDQTDQGPKG